MSTIKVEVTRITDIRPHNNADALELATIGGWQVCVKKGVYHDGDPVVYFEQDTVLPREVADRMEVTQYLSEKTDMAGNRVLVIRRVRLRGEPSFGLVATPEAGMEVGQDVADYYGAAKFFPPVKLLAGDSDTNDPRFPTYTEMENMRSYPKVIAEGEEVVATEKIHGTNARVGFVADDGQRVLMAGSRTLRRKRPLTEEDLARSTYWYPHRLPAVTALLDDLWARGYTQAILFGEVYGRGIQAFTYGQNMLAFRAFDVMVEGAYWDYDKFEQLCRQHGVETVPVVYRGPFSLPVIKRLSEGPSLVGGSHGREGVVVKPVSERTDPTIGRVILKYIGDAYLFGKVAEQDTTDV